MEGVHMQELLLAVARGLVDDKDAVSVTVSVCWRIYGAATCREKKTVFCLRWSAACFRFGLRKPDMNNRKQCDDGT